jgi:O-antigen biosynthesis protein
MSRDRSADVETVRNSGLLDAAWYCETYRDVAMLGMDAVEHYFAYGALLGRNPSPRFNTRYYLESNPDVAGQQINPLLHYVIQGIREGRSPLPAVQAASAVVHVEDVGARFVPRLDTPAPQEVEARAICFYLPQFHPIPENDEWWGEGFTEWTNVRPAKPHFRGHYQPHVPIDVGYYDLRDGNVQKWQVELAKQYGLGGFCFYFYWFAGHTLLETPVANYLGNEALDLPFCLCWANENWSRRWDGLDSEILIAQQHSPQDDLDFIAHVTRYMRDERYIRVGGKPLLLVYRPNLLPSAAETAHRWREWCRSEGLGEIYLAYTQSFEAVDPSEYGFDAAIEFPPNNSAPPNITPAVEPLAADYRGTIYDWRALVDRSDRYQEPPYVLHRSVCPGWDNTARRSSKGTVFLNNTPALYQKWLRNAVEYTHAVRSDPSERLVFVNAWNEWAEGAHLEPDARYGYAFLEATRIALSGKKRLAPRMVIVTHDCHPHGAQFLILETARQFVAMGSKVAILALDGGKLWHDFELIGPAMNCHGVGAQLARDFLARLRSEGFEDALTSTVVCGSAMPLLKELGFRSLSLIHELPGVIHAMRQEANAQSIAEYADKVVFPAALVAQGFTQIAHVPKEKIVIRAQGLLRRNPYKNRNSQARQEVCERLGLSPNCQIVLSVAYVDHRKGADMFVEAAARVASRRPAAEFIWVGHADQKVLEAALGRARELGIEGKVHFVGFDRDPLVYYAAASVYALTSREDPFPNVVLESAEVNVPVVAFEGATGASEFILQHGGSLARFLDCDSFADEVDALLDRAPRAQAAEIGSLRQYALDLLHHLNGFPRVSVVVPNYNYEAHITRRLETISAQQFPIYELIVLDDCSTDGSVPLIRSLLETIDIDSKLVVNTRNSGSVFRQWTRGAQESRGDVIWIAEADDLAAPEFVARLAPPFKDRDMVFSFCQSRQIDENGNEMAGDYLDYTSEISDIWRASYLRHGSEEVGEALSIKNTIPNVSAALFRREALVKALAQLGERLFTYRVAGDWLIYLYVVREGRIHFNHLALNSHRRHAKSVTASTDAVRHLQEVADLQRIACELAPASETARRKARDYLERLHDHFGIQRGTVEGRPA